ncbi:MAG: efflux RND transporter periplasmic adaptor subunit [Pirellula sp.]|nr:efflux RND transporter periplasmic adaptor subunit [Pirellula sp.]
MRRITSVVPLGIFVAIPGLVCTSGCIDPVHTLAYVVNETAAQGTSPSNRPASNQKSSTAAPRREIKVQGRLEPKGGFIRLSGLPGDKIELWYVRPGDVIESGTKLATLASHTVRQLELDAAKLKLDEAKTARDIKLQELELNIEVASGQLENARGLVEIAQSQREMASQGERQILQLQDQLASLRRLHEDPLTRAAVGRLELQSKEMEISGLETKSKQAVLASENAIKQAMLQVRQAEQALDAAKKAKELALKASSIAALEKQIELLELQLKESSLTSPINGVVLNINVEAGERFATLPAIEIADLSSMMCVAEVYEADVAEIQTGDSVSLRSAGLTRELSGKVSRIDRLVGVPQMRSPDPLARTDFRAVRVWIEIDANDVAIAAERVRLQADVTIRTSR